MWYKTNIILANGTKGVNLYASVKEIIFDKLMESDDVKTIKIKKFTDEEEDDDSPESLECLKENYFREKFQEHCFNGNLKEARQIYSNISPSYVCYLLEYCSEKLPQNVHIWLSNISETKTNSHPMIIINDEV